MKCFCLTFPRIPVKRCYLISFINTNYFSCKRCKLSCMNRTGEIMIWETDLDLLSQFYIIHIICLLSSQVRLIGGNPLLSIKVSFIKYMHSHIYTYMFMSINIYVYVCIYIRLRMRENDNFTVALPIVKI